MRESLDLPTIPEYVSIKEAAKMLGVSDKRVYAYIEDGRLPAMRAAHVIMIPVEEVRKFKPKISGRPRKNTPLWRTTPKDNKQFTTFIRVRIRPDQEQHLQQTLDKIKRVQAHLFSGTITRLIIKNTTHRECIEILLVWRSVTAQDEAVRMQELDAFQKEFTHVLDWSTATIEHGEVLLHT